LKNRNEEKKETVAVDVVGRGYAFCHLTRYKFLPKIMAGLLCNMDVEECLFRSSKRIVHLDSNTLGTLGLEDVVGVAATEVT
jgi:hypothetical protein